MSTILIADDEKNTREGLKTALLPLAERVLIAADGEAAWEIVSSEEVDLLITDVRMPRLDGLELLKRVKEQSPSTAVIMLTAYGSIEMAVEAIKSGAYNFLTKPVNLDQLENLVKNLQAHRVLIDENRELRQRLNLDLESAGVIGRSPAMRAVLQKVRQVAPTKAAILLTGESGTGKNLIAELIHQNSPRKEKPFRTVSCAALAESLLESELFGYEKGAFTGATRQKKGYFEVANGGTVFLDEIGEVPPHIQVKLLRVLEEHQFERVGGTETLTVDVRVIAATNADLPALVEAGKFRRDLYHRLQVVTIHLPPLRDRREDIPLLAEQFVERFAEEHGRAPMRLSPSAARALAAQPWPGNIRELRNVIESAVVLSSNNVISEDDLKAGMPLEAGEADLASGDASTELVIEPGMTLDAIERAVIFQALKQSNGNRTLAAKNLGLARRTLVRRLQEYKEAGIEIPD